MSHKSVNRQNSKNSLDNHAWFFNNSPAGCAFYVMTLLPLIFGAVFLIESIRDLNFIGALIGLAFLSLAIGLIYLREKVALHVHGSSQAWSEEEARQIYHGILTGLTVKKYYLYLRPFDTTGQMNILVSGTTLAIATDGPEEIIVSRPIIEFESMLKETLGFWAPLIGLGTPGEHFGAARMAIEDSKWQDVVRTLIRNADTVFIIPGESLGALWEFRYLFDTDYLRRTVVVMPPEALDLDIESLWSNARSALAPAGIKLPEYTGTGAFIILTNDGRPKHVLRIPKPLDAPSLHDTLKTLLWEPAINERIKNKTV